MCKYLMKIDPKSSDTADEIIEDMNRLIFLLSNRKNRCLCSCKYSKFYSGCINFFFPRILIFVSWGIWTELFHIYINDKKSKWRFWHIKKRISQLHKCFGNGARLGLYVYKFDKEKLCPKRWSSNFINVPRCFGYYWRCVWPKCKLQ